MGCTLVTEKTKGNIVSVNDMKCGDLAVVAVWTNRSDLKGKIVQRYKQTLLVLGEHYGKAFDTVFNSEYPEIVVRILEPEEQIQIEKRETEKKEGITEL